MKNVIRFISVLVLIIVTYPALAQVDINSDTVKAWADDLFSQSLEEKRLSGAIITVVRDSEVIFSRGYGYADYAAKTVINPDKTRFMIGSITKTFTATAVAQLMDRGLIDSLDDPANKYLKRDTLPQVDGKDITLKELITHTAGFGNITFHLSNDKEIAYPLSAEDVAARRPPLVRKPGGRPVYSNYSTAMIGVIIEDITGQTLKDYFLENIFTPLGMINTELNMSIHPSENQAAPYVFYPNGDAEAQVYYNIHPFFSSIGAITSTAEDMAKYMTAQMEEGRGGVSPLKISPAIFKQLHGRLAGVTPEAQGYGMIFMTDDWAGVRGYGHGGDYPGFHSIMWILPEMNAAVFFSLMAEYPSPPFIEGIVGSDRMKVNTENPVEEPLTNVGTLAEFLIHFVGPDSPLRTEERLDTDALVGNYRHEYRAYGTMEEVLDLFNGYEGVTTVEKLGEDKILINGEWPYTQVAKGVFWNSNLESSKSSQFTSSALMVFTWDPDEGKYYLTPRFTVDPFLQVGMFENPRFYTNLLIIGLILALTGLLAFAWRKSSNKVEIYTRIMAVFLPFLILAVPLVLLIGYPEGESVSTHLLLGNSSRYIAAAILSNILLMMTVVLLVLSILSWRRRFWGSGIRAVLSRFHLNLITVGGILATAVYLFINFVGWHLP